MRNLVISWFVCAVAVAIAAAVLPGVDVRGGIGTYVLVGAVVGVVNAVIRPFAQILALPLTVLTLGLFALVVNGLMLLLASAVVDRLRVDGIGWAILGAIVISIVSAILNGAVDDHRTPRRDAPAHR